MDVNEAGSSVGDNTQSAGSSVVDTGDQTPGVTDSSNSDGTQGSTVSDGNGQSSTTDGGANDIPIVKMAGKDGKEEEFIPYERFKILLDERNNYQSFMESLKSDPEARKQFVETLGLSQSNAPTAPEQPTIPPFQKFLSENVEPNMHGHYQGLAGAIVSEAQAYIDSVKQEISETLGKDIAAIKSFIGKQRLGEVESKNPDFGKYKTQVTELMRTKGLDAEEAYVLASWKDKQRQSVLTGQKQEQQRQAQMRKAPITQRNGQSVPVQKQPPKSIKEALLANFERMEEQG